MKQQFISALEAVSDVLTTAGVVSEYEEFSCDEQEFYDILMLCYDLLSRTQIAQAITVKQPVEFQEPGFDDEIVLKYGITSCSLADFAFALAKLDGEINIRNLFNETLNRAKFKGITTTQITKNTGVSSNSISVYHNGKGGITADNLEKVLNCCMKK